MRRELSFLIPLAAMLAGALVCASIPSARAQSLAQAVQRSPHATVWNYSTFDRNAKGVLVERVHSFTEIGSFLNVASAQGYVPSSDEIEIIGTNAVSRKAAGQVIFAADANNPNGTIDYLNPNGIRLRSQTVGLAFTMTNGQSVWVGELRSTIGTQTARNEILYAAAFTGIDASIRYRVTRDSFRSDLILHRQLPAPSEFGMTNLDLVNVELWHELLEGPEPHKTVIADAHIPVGGDGHTPLKEWDQLLNWGCTFFAPAQAFWTDGAGGSRPIGGGTPIHIRREWVVIGPQRFLIEKISWHEMAAALRDLPPPLALQGSEKRVFAERTGSTKGEGRRKPVSLAAAGLERDKVGEKEGKGKQVAGISRSEARVGAGFGWPYVTVNTATNLSLAGDTTYFVSSTNVVYLSGVTVAEGGTVIKFGAADVTNLTPRLEFFGRIDCRSDAYRTITLTGISDASVGELIDTNSASGFYGYNQMLFHAVGPVNLHDIRFRQGYVAGRFETNPQNEVRHAQVVGAYCGFYVEHDSVLRMGNVLMNKGTYALYARTNGTVIGEHLTVTEFDSVLYNNPNDSYYYLTNSIFASNTNGMGSYTGTLSTGYCTNYGSGAGPFQTVGKGAHYLQGNALQGLGTSQIRRDLLEDLGQRTVDPPIEIVSDFAVSQVLGPQARRDTDTPPTLGFHYSALDWVWSGLALTNSSTLVLSNGMAAAVYGTSGLTLRSGTKLVSEGSPTNFNHLVRYQAVQEKPEVWGSTASTMSLVNIVATESALPEARLRFTEISLLADTAARRLFLDTGIYDLAGALTLADSQWRGAKLEVAPVEDSRTMTVAWTNNLVEWASLDLTQGSGNQSTPLAIFFRNNLIRNSSLTLNNTTSNTAWGIYDNLLDSVTRTTTGSSFSHGWNAYLNPTNTFSGSSGGDVCLPSADYQKGPLGNYYYSGYLLWLLHTGSRSATNGLYHWTTTLDQDPGSALTVNIGMHYPAMANFELASDAFTAAQGGNHWYYRYASSAQGLPDGYLVYDAANARWGVGSDVDCMIWDGAQHPGGTYDSVRTFKAPLAGKVAISGSASVGASSDGVRLRILKNGSTLWGWTTLSPSTSTNISVTASVSAGDTIDFQVNRNGNNTTDSVLWNPKVAYYYQASEGFSGVQGANNWYYRYASTAQGPPDSDLPHYDAYWARWDGSADNIWMVAGDRQHPGATYDSVRTFQASLAGNITITGTAQPSGATADGIQIRIVKNDEVLTDWAILTAGNSTNFNFTASVKKWDLIHFKVNKNGDNTTDTLLWDPKITYDKAYLELLDKDGDGIADVIEDRNGNGSTESGETDWLSATDLGFNVFITQPKGSSIIP